MTDSDHGAAIDWRATISAIAISLGIGLIVLSLFWPSSPSAATASWTPEQAKQFQKASARLHELSHTPDNATPAQKVAHDRELKQAEAEFHTLHADLEAAINRSGRWTSILRFVGAGLIVCGFLGFYRRTSGSKSA